LFFCVCCLTIVGGRLWRAVVFAVGLGPCAITEGSVLAWSAAPLKDAGLTVFIDAVVFLTTVGIERRTTGCVAGIWGCAPAVGRVLSETSSRMGATAGPVAKLAAEFETDMLLIMAVSCWSIGPIVVWTISPTRRVISSTVSWFRVAICGVAVVLDCCARVLHLQHLQWVSWVEGADRCC
jgi:hypothetical protein